MRRVTIATAIALALTGATTTAAVAAVPDVAPAAAATAANAATATSLSVPATPTGRTRPLLHHRRGGGFAPQTATRGAVPVARPVAASADGPSSKPAVFVAGAISSLLVAATALAVLGRRRLARTLGLA